MNLHDQMLILLVAGICLLARMVSVTIVTMYPGDVWMLLLISNGLLLVVAVLLCVGCVRMKTKYVVQVPVCGDE